MCISVYHILFTFLQAEFITACLQSNANTKWIRASGFYHVILWHYDKSKSKSTLPGAFFFWILVGFFFFFGVLLTSPWSAKLQTAVPCIQWHCNPLLDGFPLLAPQCIPFCPSSALWGCSLVKSHSTGPSALWQCSPFAVASELMH